MFSKPILDQFDSFEKLSVRYAIFAGAEVALLTQNRKPTDIDIIIHNDDFDKLKNNLSQANFTVDSVFNIKSTDGQEIICTANTLEYFVYTVQFDVMSNCVFKAEDNLCETFLTDLAVKNRINMSINEHPIWLANPIDTIVIKSLMRRGHEQNKFDLEDCEILMKNCRIDKEYLAEKSKPCLRLRD